MKRIATKNSRLAIAATAFVSALLALSLTACGGSTSSASSAAESAASEAASAASEAASAASEAASEAASAASEAASEAASAASEAASAASEAASEAASAASAAASEAASAASEAAPAEAKTQSGTVTTSLDMSKYDKGKVVRVWVPVATDGDFQTITDDTIVADTAAKAEMTEDAAGNKMAYIEWDAEAEPADRKATVSFHATRTEALCPEIVESGEVPEDIAKAYLGSSKMVAADDPEVIALAEEITKDQTTFEGKARAVYDWIYDNMERDNDVIGCGDGDVCRLISEDQRAGKCTDINSVFVALCRASGVPATEMFGIRMNDADITGNQHCWCEFYVPGTGWVPADPADVLKAVLNDKLDKASEEALAKKEYYWGNWDEKRVEYSQGRDLTLEPAQAGEALNDFGYPYAEVDGEVIDFYAPADFVYSIAFEEDAK